jgi:hypothetical protein
VFGFRRFCRLGAAPNRKLANTKYLAEDLRNNRGTWLKYSTLNILGPPDASHRSVPRREGRSLVGGRAAAVNNRRRPHQLTIHTSYRPCPPACLLASLPNSPSFQLGILPTHRLPVPPTPRLSSQRKPSPHHCHFRAATSSLQVPRSAPCTHTLPGLVLPPCPGSRKGSTTTLFALQCLHPRLQVLLDVSKLLCYSFPDLL